MRWSLGWPRTPFDCTAWSRRAMTGDPAHLDGVADIYRIDLLTGPSDPPAAFERAVDRLFSYDISRRR